MSPADGITLTVGWIGRHTPKGAGAGGREAAILDIAQDLLLRELHDDGALDALVFKGGTALRKLYAGNQGRFSRLNRTTTARDMYDLAWVAQHQREIDGLDLDHIRRLAVLKIWVDANGVAGSNAVWKPGHEPRRFEPATWLRRRSAREFDLDDIGALAVPVPHRSRTGRHDQHPLRLPQRSRCSRTTACRGPRTGPRPRPTPSDRSPRRAPGHHRPLLTKARSLAEPELTWSWFVAVWVPRNDVRVVELPVWGGGPLGVDRR